MNNQFKFPFTVGEPVSVIDSDQPARRLQQFGPAALSDTELISLLLQGNGMGVPESIRTASLILHAAGCIQRLTSWTPSEYRQIPNIGPSKAVQLAAVAEVGRRMMSCPIADAPVLNAAARVFDYLTPIVIGLEVEKFFVLCLNRKNRLLKAVAITTGTATAALAHPREVFRTAIRESAAALICAHNHPSGDPAPSAPDVQVTRQLREAARATDIELLDHVIVGSASVDPQHRGYFSFREAGML